MFEGAQGGTAGGYRPHTSSIAAGYPPAVFSYPKSRKFPWSMKTANSFALWMWKHRRPSGCGIPAFGQAKSPSRREIRARARPCVLPVRQPPFPAVRFCPCRPRRPCPRACYLAERRRRGWDTVQPRRERARAHLSRILPIDEGEQPLSVTEGRLIEKSSQCKEKTSVHNTNSL